MRGMPPDDVRPPVPSTVFLTSSFEDLYSELPAGDSARAVASDPLPDRIGRYRVLSKLGTGGMGEVFLATDDVLSRDIAIKRMRRDKVHDPELRDRYGRLKAEMEAKYPDDRPSYTAGKHDFIQRALGLE